MTVATGRIGISSTVSGLSDDQLLEQTGNLARLDHQVHVFVIDHLCEIEARGLYLDRAGDTSTSVPHAERDSRGRGHSTRKPPPRPEDELTSAPKAGAQAGRPIPAAVRREVRRRDGERCRYVEPSTGRRFASRHLLQVDHVLPYTLGGGADPSTPILRRPRHLPARE